MGDAAKHAPAAAAAESPLRPGGDESDLAQALRGQRQDELAVERKRAAERAERAE
eukprot:gene12008-8494_t